MKTQTSRWLICGGCALLLFCTVGLTTSAFSVYQPYLIQIIGLSNTQASTVVTVRSLFSLLAVCFGPVYLQKLGLRRGVTLSCLGAAAGFFVFGAAAGFGLSCAAAAILGTAYGLGGMVSVSIIINRVFRSHQALALGLCTASTGVSTVVMPPIVTWLVSHHSLRGAMWTETAFLMLSAMIIFLLLRSDSLEEFSPAPKQKSGAAFSLREHKCEALLIAAIILQGTLGGVSFSHLAVLYTTAGMDSHTVSWLISLVGLTLTVGKCIYGEAADLLGGRRAAHLFGLVLIAGQVLACFAAPGNMPAAVFSMICLGLGLPLSTVGLSVLASDLVAPERYANTVKNLQMAYMGGALLFGPVPGMVADTAGSYVPAYVVMAAFSVLVFLLIATAYRIGRD